MISNFFKIAIRNLLRSKGYSFINIIGLAIGMACCAMILLFVRDELQYDRYHENADRIYRINEIVGEEGRGERSASNPFPVGPTLLFDYPEYVEASVRFFNFQAPTLAVSAGDRKFNEKRLFFVDSTLFEVFSYSLLQGDPSTALAQPNSVVLTRDMARKYFDDENPIGNVLTFEGKHDLQVTGILADLPPQSHFQFDFLVSFSSLHGIYDGIVPNGWYWNPCWTYVLLRDGVDAAALEAEMPAFIQKYFPQVIKHETTLLLQPLTDIHLRSRLDFEIEPNGDVAYVYIFSGIALFILLIACINYMNLATARSANRSREIGVRKVLGAHRSQLIRQFLAESLLMSFLSVLIAIGLMELLLPLFNSYAGKTLALNLLTDLPAMAGFFLIGAIVGVVSGVYPALFLSSFQPVRVLKKWTRTNPKHGGLRQVLVVAQFAISIVLIIGTVVATDQLSYMQQANLGFEKEQVVMVPMARTPVIARYEAFKSVLQQGPGIVSVTATEDVLGVAYQTATYVPQGFPEPRQFARLNVCENFTKTFGIEMAAGRDYSDLIPTDKVESVVINEAMVRYVGWSSPEGAIGKTMNGGTPPVKIIGVVKDFHFASLHQPVAPFVLELPNNPGGHAFFIKYLAVRIRPNTVAETLAFLERTWNEFAPERPFEYFFLDQNLDRLYRAEEALGNVATAFSVLAIFIACLGLFGLAAFMSEQRTKEIGIRKVMGASVASVVGLLSREFLKLVLLANLLAWPLGYFGMNAWLQDFAYRIDLRPMTFILAGGVALLVALLTVSYQAIRAARSNPVEALQYE